MPKTFRLALFAVIDAGLVGLGISFAEHGFIWFLAGMALFNTIFTVCLLAEEISDDA